MMSEIGIGLSILAILVVLVFVTMGMAERERHKLRQMGYSEAELDAISCGEHVPVKKKGKT